MNRIKLRRLAALALALVLALSLIGCGSELADAALSSAADAVLDQVERALDAAIAAEDPASAPAATPDATGPPAEPESEPEPTAEPAPTEDPDALVEDGWYYTPEDVALYIHTFGHLPDNYITKSEAEDRGWENREGNLWEVADGYCIGGNKFGNREGLLPAADGRTWRECDVNYAGGYRGEERLLYSNDGLIYYTDDHYDSFTRLY